jgi:hypothetical protein
MDGIGINMLRVFEFPAGSTQNREFSVAQIDAFRSGNSAIK